MSAKKIKFGKDWYLKAGQETPRQRTIIGIEQVRATRPEDLPAPLFANDVAKILRINPKVAADWMRKGYIYSRKMRGKRWTCAEWIQDFMNSEAEKNKHG